MATMKKKNPAPPQAPELSPDDIRKAREKLGLDREQFAAVLGYGGERRIRDLENGDRSPGRAVELLIFAYVHDGYRPSTGWPK